MDNKFYIYFGRGQEAQLWKSLSEPPPLALANSLYVRKTLEIMLQKLEHSGLTFYITSDAVDELPSYGQDVVAIIVGDEWARIPKYVHKVKAIFKCYGTHRILGVNSLRKSAYLNFLTLVWFSGVLLVNLPYQANYYYQKIISLIRHDATVAPIFQIPLGYCNQLDLPIKDIEARPKDISFAGSITQRNYSLFSLNRWLGNPKSISRKKMVDRLRSFKESHPNFKIELTIQPGFRASKKSNEMEYSQQLMDSKICLAPRGTSFETYRFFEAIRYGCILLTERLPSTWFYDGSPAIQIDDWNQLEPILEEILNDKDTIRKKHEESLNWWKKVCSEEVLGNYMAERLNEM